MKFTETETPNGIETNTSFDTWREFSDYQKELGKRINCSDITDRCFNGSFELFGRYYLSDRNWRLQFVGGHFMLGDTTVEYLLYHFEADLMRDWVRNYHTKPEVVKTESWFSEIWRKICSWF